jgi:site-specific DNA recombinase
MPVWISIPVPAIVSQEVYDAAQQRLDENKQMAHRNNHSHDYLLRGLVSCGQCRLSCMGRMVSPGYSYSVGVFSQHWMRLHSSNAGNW